MKALAVILTAVVLSLTAAAQIGGLGKTSTRSGQSGTTTGKRMNKTDKKKPVEKKKHKAA